MRPDSAASPPIELTPRAREIVAAARELLERGGAASRCAALADRLGIKAPSLYKHLRDKGALEAALISDAFLEAGERFEQAADLDELGAAYRAFALEHPHLYRLMFEGRLPRERLVPGAEERAAAPVIAAARRRRRPRAGPVRVRARDGDPRARRPLPGRRRPRRRVGARPQGVRAVAPAQVLDDPLGVDDHLAAELEHRHPALPGEVVDLVAVARPPGDPHASRPRVLLGQLARDPAARAQPVRRRAAAVQPRGHGTSSPSRRAAKPAARQPSGCRVPIRASRPPSRSRYQATVASTVSSCGRVRPAQLAPRLGRAVGPPVRGAAHLDRRDRRRAGQPRRASRRAPAPPSARAARPAARPPTAARDRRTGGPTCSCGCRGCSARRGRRRRRRAACPPPRPRRRPR